MGLLSLLASISRALKKVPSLRLCLQLSDAKAIQCLIVLREARKLDLCVYDSFYRKDSCKTWLSKIYGSGCNQKRQIMTALISFVPWRVIRLGNGRDHYQKVEYWLRESAMLSTEGSLKDLQRLRENPKMYRLTCCIFSRLCQFTAPLRISFWDFLLEVIH